MFPICIAVILAVAQSLASASPTYVYQKDVSEYCRRRSVPSVFLSKHVAEANAEMIHFTKLDLPYSCYISIRTESSNNIIMVIQLTSGLDLVESCAQNPNQLMVYEFGETFGGYWGPIPEAVVRVDRHTSEPRQYTLRTTRPTTTTTRTSKHTYSEPEETEAPKSKVTPETTEAPGIVYEVPLVNISVRLVPGLWKYVQSMDDEKKFDAIYDVQPGPQEKYETTVLPLVQISMHTTPDEGSNWRRGEPDSKERLYDLEYNFRQFTPDYRLTTPAVRAKSVTYRNRRLWNLRKRVKSKIASNARLFSRVPKINHNPFKKYYDLFKNKHSLTGNSDETLINEINEDSYKLIEDLVKSLKKGIDEYEYNKINESYIPIMKKIADTHHNLSVYRVPWYSYTYLPVKKVNMKITKHDTYEPRSVNMVVTSTNSLQVLKTDSIKRESTVEEKITTNSKKPIGNRTTEKHAQPSSNSDHSLQTTVTTVPTESTASTTRLNKETKPSSFPSAIKLPVKTATKAVESTPSLKKGRKDAIASSTKPSSQSGTLVDRESWENVVQAAPAIAGLLDRPPATRRSNGADAEPVTHNPRRKRSLVPIPIRPAQPHAHRTSHAAAAAASAARVADIEHFAQLIELPDDEMSERVALRFMRQYAGQTMFNICQQYEMEHKLRHLVLFNSSRIILALGNYTVPISRMTVVVTTARTLRGSEPRCPEANIECQVGGTRVCIDNTSACDGIPNCGAMDIYDEDRLECGASKGVMHNVYLAAFTFIALLLTGFYIVHYWLKRCVPKVADAFFIYTDGTENVLYLDTIMRSPTDLDVVPKGLLRESFTEQIMYSEIYKKPKRFSIITRITSRIFKLMHLKQKHSVILFNEDITDKLKSETRKKYSFTEMELQNITRNWKVDEGVQTGESLEMAYIKILNSKKISIQGEHSKPTGHSGSILMHAPPKKENKQNSIDSSDDLSFPSTSVASLNVRRLVDDEKELDNTLYELHEDDKKTTRTIGTYQTRKRLRFNNASQLVESEGTPATTTTTRRSVVLPQSSRPLFRNINSVEGPQHDQEQGTSDIRKSFFMGKKSKEKKDFK